MAVFAKILGESLDGASQPANMRGEGIDDHQDFHVAVQITDREVPAILPGALGGDLRSRLRKRIP